MLTLLEISNSDYYTLELDFNRITIYDNFVCSYRIRGFGQTMAGLHIKHISMVRAHDSVAEDRAISKRISLVRAYVAHSVELSVKVEYYDFSPVYRNYLPLPRPDFSEFRHFD